MNTTCAGAGNMRYAPSRARIRWLATLPMGCACPLESIRTNSARPSFIETSSLAQLRDRSSEHSLQTPQKTVIRGDSRPLEIQHGLGSLTQCKHELDRAGARRRLNQDLQGLEIAPRG